MASIEPGFFGTEIDANNLSTDESVSDVFAVDQEWIRLFFQAGIDEGADPAVVADAIVSAATDPATRLHTPVGDDAAMFLDLQNQVDGYEGWMEAVVPDRGGRRRTADHRRLTRGPQLRERARRTPWALVRQASAARPRPCR